MEHQQLNSGGNPPHLPPATPGTQQGEDNKITPELLVDALSGHEDGLLSIAERLMTHYDSGYDASEFRFERYFASSEGECQTNAILLSSTSTLSVGEAIIDAFADVQKLFQHVVEVSKI